MLGLVVLSICILLAPATLLAFATGLLGRGRLSVHPFYAARAQRIGQRAWKLTLVVVVAGAVGAVVGSLFVVGGEGIGLAQALIGMQVAQLGVLGFDAARVRGGHWSGHVRGERRCWATVTLVAACLAPVAVLAVGLVFTRSAPFFFGLGSLPILVPGLVAAGVGLLAGRRGVDFGRWYATHQSFHGGCLAAYSAAIPVLGLRTLMSGLVYPLLGMPIQDLEPGTVPTAVCAGAAVIGWLFHAGRLAVLPRVIAAEAFVDGDSSGAGSRWVVWGR